LGGVDKPLIWLGSSRSALRNFPDDARRVAGFQLRRVQQGIEPNDWKDTYETEDDAIDR
jgi:phage-related protein